MSGAIPPFPNTPSWRGAQFKHKDNFTFFTCLGFDFRRGLGIFLFITASRTALGPAQPPVKWVPRTLSLGVKWPVREADHSPPYSAEVNNALHSPIRLHGVVYSLSIGTTLLFLHLPLGVQ
jgi:hypothetical protein